ncbi:MAG: flagellar basal body rod protein FlgC [Clostridia bacterium]|nr:flagellar basal body rod protein FlgC [Clostridia bacterium]
MSFFGSMDISASGLAANRTRMDLISQNIANAETNGYKRKSLIVEEKLTSEKDFRKILNSKLKGTNTINNEFATGAGVEVTKIFEDGEGMLTVYDPNDPNADENGYVTKSNVNIVEEMVNMISASRSYEANATALDANKQMAQKALEIGN